MKFSRHLRRVRYITPLDVAAILAREDRERRERAAAAAAAAPAPADRPPVPLSSTFSPLSSPR